MNDTQIDHFQIIERIAGDKLYRARDVRDGRPVLLRLLAPPDRAAFLRGVAALTPLHHPHLLPILGAGEWRDLCYLATADLPDSLTLAQLHLRYRQRDELIPPADTLRIIGQSADALTYLHNANILHSNVCTQNVVIDTNGAAYLTHAGVAVLHNTWNSIGTVAPEVLHNPNAGTPASDVYSLGALAYELLTGDAPFRRATPTQEVSAALIDPPPPPRALNPALPVGVENALLRALAKTPTERFPQALTFTQALEQSWETLPDAPTTGRVWSNIPAGVEVTRALGGAVFTPPQRPLEIPAQPPTEYAPLRDQGEVGYISPRAAPPSREFPLWLPLVIVSALTVIALGITLILWLLNDANDLTEAALTNTQIAAQVTQTADPQVIIVPTLPPTQPAPAATVITLPPTLTPTFTPVPPTQTPTLTFTPSITYTPSLTFTPSQTFTPPPTLTVPPPGSIPTLAPLPANPGFTPPPAQSGGAGSTAVPPNTPMITLSYDANAFTLLNNSTRGVDLNRLTFQSVGGSEAFLGSRWAVYYNEVERNGACVRLNVPDGGAQTDPGCRRFNADITARLSELFWLDGQFRVLWDGVNIGTCGGGTGQCQVAVPG